MTTASDELDTVRALEAEVEFVLTLGGLALRLPGATLVTHEKIPVPRFNFVWTRGVGPERQTAFFEKTLDHYFQRAIRPSFRVPAPVGAHLDRGLRRLGFQLRPEPLTLMIERSEAPRDREVASRVRVAEASDLDRIAEFWTGAKERPEFRAAVDIAWHHPNPDEELVPLLARLDGEPAAAALVYRHGDAAGIHLVATHLAARGRGAASDLVRFALRERPLRQNVRFSIFADSQRLRGRLAKLGFEAARSFAEYDLPRSAELALPRPGPPGPPRWRPPRGAPTTT